LKIVMLVGCLYVIFMSVPIHVDGSRLWAELRLDRDRMAFQNPDDFLTHTSLIAADTLNILVEDPEKVPNAKILIARVIFGISGSQLPSLYAHINQKVVEMFWEKFAQANPNQQPTSSYQPNEYSVAVKFSRLYVAINHYLYVLLRRSQNFKSPQTWLNNVIQRPQYKYDCESQGLMEEAKAGITSNATIGLKDVKVLQDEEHHNYISCVKDGCLYIPHSQVEHELKVLQNLDCSFTIKHALLMLAFRWKSSDYCIQL